MNRLIEAVKVRKRFSRSANVERDLFTDAISGYLPTPRALDVIRRVVDGLQDPGIGSAISVTGPYGSGKSSLALFLSALLGQDGVARARADVLLFECDPGLARRLEEVRSIGGRTGFICAPVVGRREPIVDTLMRGLLAGVNRFVEANPGTRRKRGIREFSRFPQVAGDVQIKEALNALTSVAPVLIVLDEFGKNLEQFASTDHPSNDLYVLQEIAEWSRAAGEFPVVLLTMQHLAFDEYAAGASSTRRREWSKIQGRFIDVPYVESPAQAQRLIASVFEKTIDLSKWSSAIVEELRASECMDLLHASPSDLYPLHPITAAVLPDLCARYGQNERTLFSFLAGPDAMAVPEFLSQTSFDSRLMLPCVRLDRVYDFFLESASTMVSASASASRWLEIETRIRDSSGLSEPELEVLKSIAVLNLVAVGGSLRASRSLLKIVVRDQGAGSDSAINLESCLAKLEEKGLVTYRDYVDEYRVWNGSDFDLRGEIELAKRRAADTSVPEILERVRPQTPVVAARHSQRTGTLRVFERRFVGSDVGDVSDEWANGRDGLVLLCLDPDAAATLVSEQSSFPIIVGRSPLIKEVEEAARELNAHLEVIGRSVDLSDDWVAKRELSERASSVAVSLDAAIERAFGTSAVGIQWFVCGDSGEQRRLRAHQPLSSLLSDICDEKYMHAPVIRNEMVARRDLTSQGARARRELLTAMVQSSEKERCGIEGYGPERAIYEALLARTGIHRVRNGRFSFGAPRPTHKTKDLNFGHVWRLMESCFTEAADAPMSVQEIYRRLMAPPVGLKEGTLPILVTAAMLSNRDSIALYENGSFVTTVDSPVVERLLRNPELFTVKRFSARGQRATLTREVGEILGLDSGGDARDDVKSVVAVVGALLRRVRSLPAYSQRTKRVGEHSVALRNACFTATEPDVLLFETLPEALGIVRGPARSPNRAEIEVYAGRLASALTDLEAAFGGLLIHIENALRDSLVVRGNDLRTNLVGRISQFADAVLDPQVKSFVMALTDTALLREEWLEYVGMVVSGKPPASWVDEDVRHFDLLLDERSQAVRRLEGLHFELRDTKGEGFESIRVGFTTPDGIDRARVLTMEESAREDLDQLLGELLNRAQTTLGAHGDEMLLARLAVEVLGDKITQADDGMVGTKPERLRAHG